MLGMLLKTIQKLQMSHSAGARLLIKDISKLMPISKLLH